MHATSLNIHPVRSGLHQSLSAIRSGAHDHLQSITSNKSEIRHIDVNLAEDDTDFLAQIGYKQELVRSYSTFQVFGIAFSIMGLLPLIATTLATGAEFSMVGIVWGWFVACIFITCIGLSLSMLASSISTSGALFYYANYYSPDSIRVPLSFVIACSNTLGLCGGICSITYGFAGQVLAAAYMTTNGAFEITSGIEYGVYAAGIIVEIILCCVFTRHTAFLQSVSIYVNCFLIVLFFIAVPIGASHNGFNSGEFIFGNAENFRTWTPGWSFILSMMPAIWTIGSFDSCMHMSEECKEPQRKVPIGIVGSITACAVVGWFICIACAAMIKDGDVARVMDTDTGSFMAQIIYDALGRNWAIAFISLIAFGQLLMAVSLLIAASRQIFAFARDRGLPFVHNYVKYVNPKIKVPIRATIFGGILCLVLGLLILINTTAANALFSLAVVGNLLAWGVPVLLILLPVGKSRFVPGPFYLGKVLSPIINVITVLWIIFIIIMAMFPDSKTVDKESMNYTCVINVGVWILSIVYYYAYGYRHYSGPRSNLDEPSADSSSDGNEVHNIDETLGEKA